MNWLEIAVTASYAAAEAVADVFAELGAGGTVVEDPRELNFHIKSGLWDATDLKEVADTGQIVIKAYLPQDDRLKAKLSALEKCLSRIRERMSGTVDKELVFRRVGDEDWENSWKQYFHPVRLGQRIVVKPTWEEYTALPDDLVLTLDPGMAFGTGDHHTTRLCAEKLEEIVRPGQTVFDVGTGSGILSLLCARLGADRVAAVDFDPLAVAVARENVALNALADKISVAQGDLLAPTVGRADVIVANIVADAIKKLLPGVPQKLAPDGIFLAGGVISERAAEIADAAGAAGLAVAETRERGGWALLAMRKKS
jgi:ribosomal protein L11 methyltransferase